MPSDPPSPMPAESSGVAVLDRAFSLLAAFGPSDGGLTLSELSRRTGLYKSTVLRLLAALEHGGFIRRLREGLYSIGPQPLRLASIYQRSFDAAAVIEPMLKQLSARTGETASYYVRHQEKRIALFRVEPSRSVRASVQVGQEYTIFQGASGKVLLAFSLPPEPAHAEVRQRLWAISYGERDPETASVAAPVFGVSGDLQGAITLSGPLARLSDRDTLRQACRLVLEAAGDATNAFGGSATRHAQSLAALPGTSLVG